MNKNHFKFILSALMYTRVYPWLRNVGKKNLYRCFDLSFWTYVHSFYVRFYQIIKVQHPYVIKACVRPSRYGTWHIQYVVTISVSRMLINGFSLVLVFLQHEGKLFILYGRKPIMSLTKYCWLCLFLVHYTATHFPAYLRGLNANFFLFHVPDLGQRQSCMW